MTTQTAQNLWDLAFDPPAQQKDYFGRCTLSVWTCMLVKGAGKMPYDPQTLDPVTGKPPRKNTAIKVAIDVLAETPFELTREYIAEFGDWPDTVLPSIKALGITNLQQLNNAWVRAELAETGDTYVNKNGETKHSTTIRFLELYPNEAACRAAQGQASATPNASSATPMQGQASTIPNQAAAGNGNNERETALRFLDAYVKKALGQSAQDIVKAQELLRPMIAGQTLLAKYFTADSPEVLDRLTQLQQPPF
jgi:hypothetical protein